MNKQQQEAHLKAFTERMASILLSKGDDYANEDRLSNFKLAGTICGLKPEQNCLSLIATKVARLGVLIKSEKKPNNESIRDSIIDLANYAALLDMIVEDGDICKKITEMMPGDEQYVMLDDRDRVMNGTEHLFIPKLSNTQV